MIRTALIAVLLAGPVWADPALECSRKGSQVEIGACVAEMGRRVDHALGVAFEIAQGAAADLDAATDREVYGPALEASQAAWSAYRDAQCEAVGAAFGGGSGTGIGIAACRVELGRERVAELLDMVP